MGPKKRFFFEECTFRMIRFVKGGFNRYKGPTAAAQPRSMVHRQATGSSVAQQF
jgi:hypothetical protein